MSKVLAIGDIHAKSWILYEVAELIDLYDKVVFLGDFADDWGASPTDSIATWRLVKQMMRSDKVYSVISNHCFAYIHPEIAGRSSGWSPATFALINSPENRDLKDWLLSLPVTIELDGVTFSHAGVTNEWNGDESVYGLWNDTSPIWARPKEFGGNITYKKIPQVIGHNPSKKIWNPAPNIWCIDVFSTTPDGKNIGDQTVLEIINGREFVPTKLSEIKSENNDSSTDFENFLS